MIANIVFQFVLLAADADTQPAAAQRVHRCVGQHGEIVFSGLPCSGESAAIAGVSAIADGATTAPLPQQAAVSAACPASREELRERIAAAIARRNANGFASLLRWNGIGGGGANSRMRELRDLTQRPLLTIDDGDAAADEAKPAAADGLRVRTGSGAEGGVREHAFGVSAGAGCYWLEW